MKLIKEKFKRIWDNILNKKNIILININKEENIYKKKEFNLENPLKPFFPKYEKPNEDANYLIQKYVSQNRPLTEDNYKEVFEKYICIKSFLNENKINYLKDIWEDANYINNLLEPIRKLNIKYTLDLTGGSARDFVLNNQEKIKDLDFMISLEKNMTNFTLKNLINSKIFNEDEIKNVKWQDNDDVEIKKSKIIELCLNKSKSKMTVFQHRKKDETVVSCATTSYGPLLAQDRLISVIKLEGNTNYPIDILLTDFVKSKFIEDFDFDLCKASFCFVNPFYKKEFPKNHSHLISRFVADLDFWADVYNNTNTYNTNNRSKYDIDRSFDNHLPRIVAKYPNNKLLIVGSKDIKNYADKKAFKNELNNELNKEKILVKKKIKI